MEQIAFEAVGGHIDKIVYGELTSSGNKTIVKETTGWEILWYIAFFLCDKDKRSADFHVWEKNSEADIFLRSVRPFKIFAPVACSFSLDNASWINCFSIVKKDINSILDKSIRSSKVMMEDAEYFVLESLFRAMWSGIRFLHGFDDAYDKVVWKLRLEDFTDGFKEPCATDIKLGSCCYSPFTAEDKKKRYDDRSTLLVRETGLRICGMHRYLCDPFQSMNSGSSGAVRSGDSGCVSVSPYKEKTEKKFFYAIQTEVELVCCLAHFVCCSVPLGELRDDGTVYLHKIRVNNGDCLPTRRLREALQEVKKLLFFFENTAEGKNLIKNMAFISSSLLILFDKCCSPETLSPTRVFFIDFARCGIRRLNFEENKVGFLHALQIVVKFFNKALALCSNEATNDQSEK